MGNSIDAVTANAGAAALPGPVAGRTWLYPNQFDRFILDAYFYFFTLFWIFPLAVFTVRARGWLTR